MSLLILILATIACFGLLFFFRHYFDSVTLISLAIGAAINANLYNSSNMPIEAGWMILGIDSMLYTLFMFTVLWKARDYSISSAKSMTISTVIAIIVSAAIETFARWSFMGGLDWEVGKVILGYVISAFASGIAVWVMLYIFRNTDARRVPVSLEFILCIFVASMIHSIIHSGLVALINWELPVNVLRRWVGSLVVRLVCGGFGCLVYYLNHKYWKPRNLEVHYRGDFKHYD